MVKQTTPFSHGLNTQVLAVATEQRGTVHRERFELELERCVDHWRREMAFCIEDAATVLEADARNGRNPDGMQLAAGLYQCGVFVLGAEGAE